MHFVYDSVAKELIVTVKMKWLNIALAIISIAIVGIVLLYGIMETAAERAIHRMEKSEVRKAPSYNEAKQLFSPDRKQTIYTEFSLQTKALYYIDSPVWFVIICMLPLEIDRRFLLRRTTDALWSNGTNDNVDHSVVYRLA